MKQGKIIVIEGGDSSGKATQTTLLRKQLEEEGIVVVEMDFPRYADNQVGALIRECLDGKHGDFLNTDPRICSVFYATDRRQSLPQIKEWMEEGKVIIFDRYTSASMLHQGAKVNDSEKRKEILEWIYHLEFETMGLPKPDLLLYLEVPAPIRMELLRKQNEENGRTLDLAEQNAEHQEMVDKVAKDMLAMFDNSIEIQCVQDGHILPKEEIANVIAKEVRAIL